MSFLTKKDKIMYYDKFSTQLCDIILVGDRQGINQLLINDGHHKIVIKDHWQHSTTFFSDAKQQIREYFSGERKTFDLQLNPTGTVFQKHAWQKLQAIPYGDVKRHKEIAVTLGNHNTPSIIISANDCNPIPIIIPSHRITGSEAEMKQYSKHRKLNQLLRDFEQGLFQQPKQYKTHNKPKKK